MRTAFARIRGPAVAVFAVVVRLGAQAVPAQPLSHRTPEVLASQLNALRAGAEGALVPSADQFTFGERTVAAGSRVSGPVAVADGSVHVHGTVAGDVFAYGGDVVVHDGGAVLGNALAVEGKVTLEGGRVTGEMRSLTGNLQPIAVDAAPGRRSRLAGLGAVALAGGWLAVLVVVGIGVLVLASPNLDAVTDTLERDFGRALLTGVAGQLALLPVLVLLLIALALTVLGILLIPFAIVAYVLAVCGLVTLGYLAIARITGRSLLDASGMDERSRRAASLRAMLFGLVLLMSPWLLAAVLGGTPMAGVVARAVAIAVTWSAATAGLGAAIISRGGVRRAPAPAAQRAMASAGWQTPTPIAGVAAVRRPTAPSTTSL